MICHTLGSRTSRPRSEAYVISILRVKNPSAFTTNDLDKKYTYKTKKRILMGRWIFVLLSGFQKGNNRSIAIQNGRIHFCIDIKICFDRQQVFVRASSKYTQNICAYRRSSIDYKASK